MKKMFFTAIALVAFSASSMGNTIEIEEVVPVKEEAKEVVIKREPCDVIWIYYYQSYIDSHAGSAGSPAAWNYADNLSAMNGC